MPSNQRFTEKDFVLEKGEAYEDCEFDSVDFSILSLKNCSFVECSFHNCNLANVELLSGSIRNCHFKGSNLIGINWCLLNNFSSPKFEFCKLN